MIARARRLRAGELLTLTGTVALVVSLFVREFQRAGETLDAWSTFDAGVVLLILGALAGLVLVVAALAERTTALPMAATVGAVPLALAACIAALARALALPGGASETCFGAWLALAGAALILLGAWQTMRDEHRPLYPPARPEPRPLP